MQDTQELTLPVSKKSVTVRGYVTGAIEREVETIRKGANKTSFEVAVDNMTEEQMANMGSGSFPPGTKLVLNQDPTANDKADDKLLELMVSSLDGNTGDVFNRLMELPASDVAFVRAKVTEIEKASSVEGSDPKAPNS